MRDKIIKFLVLLFLPMALCWIVFQSNPENSKIEQEEKSGVVVDQFDSFGGN